MNPISLFEKQADSPIWKGIWFLFFFAADYFHASGGLIWFIPKWWLRLRIDSGGFTDRMGIPKIAFRREFSENAIPLFCFVIVSLISTAVSFFYKFPYINNQIL
jgi:hypothetical protein